jgi:cytochrome c
MPIRSELNRPVQPLRLAANIDMLVNKVINGGKGNWGDVPMAPHPQLKKEDVTEMVKYILSLKK